MNPIKIPWNPVEPILTWKCASRHNGVHFFDISTSKSAPKLARFVHFDLEMCFATQQCAPKALYHFILFDLHMCFVPQLRALFKELNFQKCYNNEVLLAFWLQNLLRATAACDFVSHICSDGSTPRFSAPTFSPYFLTLWSHNTLEKLSVARLVYLFVHLDLLSTESFSSVSCSSDPSVLWMLSPLLHLSISRKFDVCPSNILSNPTDFPSHSYQIKSQHTSLYPINITLISH